MMQARIYLTSMVNREHGATNALIQLIELHHDTCVYNDLKVHYVTFIMKG